LSLLALFAFIAISPCFADYFEQSWEAAATARRDLTSISNLDDLKRAIENNAQAVEVDLYDRNWRKTDILTEADLEGLAKLPHLKKLTFMPLFESVRTSKYLRHLKHLEVLTCPIGGDEATAAIPLSAPLRSLTVYGITNKSLPRIGHFKNLEILSVQGDITDEGLKSLESLTHLKELFLGSQSITGEGLKYFSKNKDLKKLEWSSSIRLGDAAMSSLKFFPNLRILNIRNSSVTDAGFANVAQLKNLEMLECGFTEVTDHGMKALSGLDKLSSVSLQGMNVTDEGMRYLSTVPNLQMLSLSELGITDQSIEYLSRLPKLSRLSFWEVNISDKALPWFRKMPALKSLEVKFSRAPNSELQRFSQSIKPKLPSTHKAQIVTKPLVADGCVLFRLENGAFICLDANSGKELWRRQGYWNSSFRVVGNTLFRYSGGNPSATVTAIQPRSGVEIWNYAIKSVDKDLSLSAYAKLVTDSSNAYVVRHDGRVICLDQKNGNCKWDNRLPNIIRCWFVYQDARFIYLQTTLREDEDDEQESVPTKVMAVSKDTGSIAWTAKPMYDSKDEICFCSCPEFDCIFLVSPSAKVDVLDRSTGNVLCNRDLLHYAFSSSESDEASVLFDDHGLSLFYIAKTSAETYQLASYGLVRKNGKVELFEGIKSKPIFRPESQRLHKDTIPKLQALRRNIIIITSDKKLICLDTKTRRRVQSCLRGNYWQVF
jgi:Leucine-rich repeat (LRR) protein